MSLLFEMVRFPPFYGWITFRCIYSMYHIFFFIQLLMDTQVVINDAVVNVGVQLYLWDSDFIPRIMCPEVGLLSPTAVLVSLLWGAPHTVFRSGCTSWHSHRQHTGLPFSLIRANTSAPCVFDDSHCNRPEALSHCCFDVQMVFHR